MDQDEAEIAARTGKRVPPKRQPSQAERQLAVSVRAAMSKVGVATRNRLEQWREAEWSGAALLEKERRNGGPFFGVEGETARLDLGGGRIVILCAHRRRQMLELRSYRECIKELLGEGLPFEEPAADRQHRALRILFIHHLLSDPDLLYGDEPYRGPEAAPGERRWGSRAWAYAGIQGDTRGRWHELVRLALQEVGENQSRDDSPAVSTDIGHEPVTNVERALLDVLYKALPGEGLVGWRLIDALVEKGFHGVSQSSLTTRSVPGLRNRGWKLPNGRRGAGYFLAEEDRSRYERLFGLSGQ